MITVDTCLFIVALNDSEEEGTRHFMVNVIEPQFNLHSEDANVSCDFCICKHICSSQYISKRIICHCKYSQHFLNL